MDAGFTKVRFSFISLTAIMLFAVTAFAQSSNPYDIQTHITKISGQATAQADAQKQSGAADESAEAIQVLDEAQLQALLALKQQSSKLAWPLQRAAAIAETSNQKDGERTELTAMDPVLRMRDGRLPIDIVVRNDVEEALRELKGMGLQNAVAYGSMISGEIPVGELRALDRVDWIQVVHPAAYDTNAGLVTSRGDVSMAADAVRSQYGLDGAGLTIGTLSDSYDCLGGAAADVANNDLPAGVNVLVDSCAGDIDEGRAMMQLIHDVAPGSSQAFHTANGGQAAFANGIIDLYLLAGSDIIVDDIIYFAEPMFQDGIVAQAVDKVKGNGVSYFSAAGNYGRDSYEAAYVDSGVAGLSGGNLHDFDPGPGVDFLQNYTLGSGTTIFIFQWDQPFFSVSGAPGSASDLDMLIFSGGSFTGLGGFTLNIGGDAVEVFGITNSGGPATIQIAIELAGGPAPGLMKYVWSDSGGNSVDEFDTASSTIWGHSNAAGGMAIGSSAWYNTVAWNPFITSAVLNSVSSIGPTPILYTQQGNPTFDQRQKPDVVGPDGTNTTFFGADLPFAVPGTTEPDGFPNFFGTSAAAPHVAAAAALLLEAVPSLTPDQVYGLIEQFADDMDDPATAGFDTGFDFASGFGFVNILDAINDQVICCNGAGIIICYQGVTRRIRIQNLALALSLGAKVGPCN
jgi:hypothetical protein